MTLKKDDLNKDDPTRRQLERKKMALQVNKTKFVEIFFKMLSLCQFFLSCCLPVRSSSYMVWYSTVKVVGKVRLKLNQSSFSWGWD